MKDWSHSARKGAAALEHSHPRACRCCGTRSYRGDYCTKTCEKKASRRRSMGQPVADPILTVKACQWCDAAASVQLLYRLPLEGRPIVCNDCRRLWLDGVTPVEARA